MTPTTTDINALVAQHVIGRMFGIFDPRVNVPETVAEDSVPSTSYLC